MVRVIPKLFENLSKGRRNPDKAKLSATLRALLSDPRIRVSLKQ